MKILKMGLFLALVAALAGGALAFVNNITAPIIAENAIASEKANLQKIFPDASEFLIIEDFEDEAGLVIGVYEAVGYGMAYKVRVTGYANPIVFMLGISDDAKIVGFAVLELNDTPGIGDRIEKPEFTDNVIGKTTTDGIPVLSGATVTSAAVVKGINAARTMFNESKGIDDDGSGGIITPPPLQFGPSIGIFSTQTDRVSGEVMDKTTDGDIVTYIVSSRGYAVLEGGYDDAKPNVFEVVINRADNVIVSVSFIEMNDTQGFGDKIDADEFWEQFVDLDITDDTIEIDVVSGATMTSVSAARAVRAAIED